MSTIDARKIVEDALDKAWHEANKKHDKWRNRVKKGLPGLASRVFVLRGTGYNGCGFHYDLERQLGVIIKEVNSVNVDTFKPTRMLFIEIATERLYNELAKIERELKFLKRFEDRSDVEEGTSESIKQE